MEKKTQFSSDSKYQYIEYDKILPLNRFMNIYIFESEFSE